MSGTFCLSLKARQRLFINGAVLRFDRKVGIELLNDAVFLLESHVLQSDEVTSPLRQLYFIAQTMLMDPDCKVRAVSIFRHQFDAISEIYINEPMVTFMNEVKIEFEAGRIISALKCLRRMFPIEAEILAVKAGPGLCGSGQAVQEVA